MAPWHLAPFIGCGDNDIQRLSDIFMSKLNQRSASLAELSSTGGTPNLAGTKNYTALEYHLGYKSTNRSDIYSIGVIVFERLTAKSPYGKPFETKNPFRIFEINPKNSHPSSIDSTERGCSKLKIYAE